jgi:hypothetical protein
LSYRPSIIRARRFSNEKSNRLFGLIDSCFGFFSTGSFASREITRWRDNHAAAISLNFGDDYLSQFTNALPLLNDRKLKATFFLVTNSPPYQGVTWEQWGEVAKQRHEIGSHSVTHPDLTKLSEQEIREELRQSQEVINQNIPSQACLSLEIHKKVIVVVVCEKK